jgi:hypothetical protein
MKWWMGVIFGIIVGAGVGARATVACGTFDTTQLELTEVRRDGVVQPLPAERNGYVGSSSGFGRLYQPALGQFVDIRWRYQP